MSALSIHVKVVSTMVADYCRARDGWWRREALCCIQRNFPRSRLFHETSNSRRCHLTLVTHDVKARTGQVRCETKRFNLVPSAREMIRTALRQDSEVTNSYEFPEQPRAKHVLPYAFRNKTVRCSSYSASG